MTLFVDVVYSTYFLHILLLQHRDMETNPGPQKEKIKILSCCDFLSLKHIIQFINMILSVYPKHSLTLQCKKGTKTSNWMATIYSGQIIQVIQNEVVFYLLQRNSRCMHG